MGMKAFVSWSGGKDTSLALYKAKKIHNLEVKYLLNMVSEDGMRSRSHGLGSELLKIQAQAMGIPIVQRKTTRQDYEEEFKKAVASFVKEGVRAGVFGDIDFQEHRDWIERVCKEVGIKPILPLWKEKREDLLKEFIDVGFRATVVTTQAGLLGKEWLGREVNQKFVEDLRLSDNVDLCGEKGEYHTFVYDGPMFKKRIEITKSAPRYKKKRWFLDILKWRIV
ncbi:MAG: diphthine--ammonia ligase [Candidatus Omnitrophota bacterium]